MFVFALTQFFIRVYTIWEQKFLLFEEVIHAYHTACGCEQLLRIL